MPVNHREFQLLSAQIKLTESSKSHTHILLTAIASLFALTVHLTLSIRSVAAGAEDFDVRDVTDMI